MEDPPTWKKSSSTPTVLWSTPNVSAHALVTAASMGVSPAPPPRALFWPFQSVKSACESHVPFALRGILSTAMTSLGSRNPGRHRLAKDMTFTASTVAGVTIPIITLLPVVSITAAVSSTPGAFDNAAATRAVASSRVAALFRPLRTVAAKSASNVTSSSDIPSRISHTSRVFAICDRETFPDASLGIWSTRIKHCGHFEGGNLSCTCWHSCRKPGSWIPLVGTTTTPTVS
mmetsp:Transcript_3632/g.13392  ORF Transcript_3632/g.13392 Transcript_3632/m.13392 type:complete len:231 (-) Transcript_3632:2104-2796(-)